jgi:hypothetical protein
MEDITMNTLQPVNLIKGLLTVLCIALLTGCASTPSTKLVEYPPLPITKGELDYKLYDMPTTKFVAEFGKNSITKDGVTVKIVDISDELRDDRFSTTITGPDEKEHNATITPMMLVLKITNGTDHILTLRRTIIKIEDKNQNDFPLISNIPSAKSDLMQKVGKSFDRYIEDAKNFFRKNILEHAAYKNQYEKFVMDLTAAFQSGQTRTQDQAKEKILTQYGVERIIKIRSPQALYDTNVNMFSQKIQLLKGNAMTKVQTDLPNNVNNIITGGVYQPINMLPGRTTKIIVPFNVRKEGEVIEKLYVNIFDLPTIVDNAGNPTKRTHFNFTMKAVK